MAEALGPKKVSNIGVNGIVRPAAVVDALIPDGAVTEAINFHFDTKGASTVRGGIAGLGSTILASRPAVGLHNTLSRTAVVAFTNGGSSAIYTYSGSAWGLSLDGGTASIALRFVDFGSFTILLNFNYNTYTSMRFWAGGADGASYWKTTGNPINPQNMSRACQVGEVYKSRVYLAADESKEGNTSRLYFSSVISTAGNIDWTPSTDYVDINPGDGEGITALKRFSLELLVFKPNYIYRFRTSGVDPDPLIKVGTRSQESVIEGQRGVYFHHDTGFYRYSGGYPVKISNPIVDIVEAIPFSQYDNIVAWSEDDTINWSIGNITIDETKEDVTWRNVVLRYTESSDVWTVYSTSNEVRRGITYNSGSNLSRIVATDHGVVGTWDSGTTDFGEPIKYRLKTKWYEWEGIARRKVINEMVAICEKAQAVELAYQIDEDPAWHSLGQMKKLITYFERLSIKFHRIRFMVTGVSRFEVTVFKGLEVIDGINEGIVKYD